nr:unnamed protein product [Spirometra erinaceieuropaei]
MAVAVLGHTRHQHQDCFDDNGATISNQLVKRNSLHKAYANRTTDDNTAAFYRNCPLVQQRLRKMQDAWTARKAEEIRGYTDCNEWKNFFSAIKVVYGPPTKGTARLLGADDSTLLTEKTQILQRCPEHFRSVLNRPPPRPTPPSLVCLKWRPTSTSTSTTSLDENIRVVQQLSSGKAPGSDATPAEVYKHGGPQIMGHLTALFHAMWRQGKVPQDFKDATIVHLHKWKGSHQLCDNHRSLFLLNIAGMIFARILPNRLNQHLEQDLMPESHRHDLRRPSIAGEVSRDADPPLLYLRGSGKSIRHGGSRRIVKDHAEIRLPRTIHSDGAFMFSAMLMDAFRDKRPEIRIAHRTDGEFLNHRRMHSQSCVFTTTVHKLLFADDCALDATLKWGMQRGVDLFSPPATTSARSSTRRKMVLMHQPPLDAANVAPQINVKGVQLQAVVNFTYPGSTLSHTTKIDDEVVRQISKACRLQSTVWDRQDLHLNTKLKMYEAIILPTLLHGTQTWTVYKKQAR